MALQAESSEVKKAPELDIPDLDGKRVKISKYKGQVIAVNFWATWCPPCREELPSMQDTYQALKKDGFVILAVNIGEDWDTVTPFISQFNINFPVLFDRENKMMGKWGARGLPTTFLIDKKGNIIKRITGGRDWNTEKFRKLIKDALAK